MTLAIAGFAHFPPELLLFLAASLLLWSQVHRVLLRLTAWCCYEWGAFRATLALTRFLERLPLAAWMRSVLWREELYAHSALGNTETAVAGARRLAVHAKAD